MRRFRSYSRELILSLLLSSSSIGTASESEYVGSKTCATCHERAYTDWQQSDHKRSMEMANSTSVLGDFNEQIVSFSDIENRFYSRDDSYFVETIDRQGRTREFRISYTFGFYPLQQYLIETTGGHIQAFTIAWDSRPHEDGGQRWINLQPTEDINPDSPFFWMAHLQNWNSRCAECHSTDIAKHYDAKKHAYNTTWSEINVGCEACHGPGEEHVQRVKNNNLVAGSGLFNEPVKTRWEFSPDESIAHPAGAKSNTQINMCGGCHSRRSIIGELKPGGDFHDQYRLTTLRENLYHPDGQIQDEVFVLGSFLQSKMHGRGVTCSDCHHPHSGKVFAQNNNLCARCHKPDVFDTPNHHFHPADSPGAQCVECHMPQTTYMQVDERRDHRFGIPNPSVEGSPNPCNSCHKATTRSWASNKLSQWYDKPPSPTRFASVNSLARSGDPVSTNPLVNTIADAAVPAIQKATLLEHLSNFPSRVGIEAQMSYLSHNSPLVRSAAARSMRLAPAEIRWQSLKHLAEDPVKTVRYAVAEAISDIQSEIPLKDIGVFYDLIGEYRESLSLSNDMPSTQTEIANLELGLGNADKAESAYLAALLIEPHFVPALLNLADLYRATNRESKAKTYLDRALAFAPDSGAVNYSYGLSLVRQTKYEEALPFLKAATQQMDSEPRYAYAYAVALDSINRTKQALVFLEQANAHWPNQYNLLMTQVLYMEKLGQTENMPGLLSKLSRLAPNAPEVKQRVRRYIERQNPGQREN